MYLFFAFNFSTKGPTLTLDFLCMRSARRHAQSTGDMMIRADGGGGCGWMSEKKVDDEMWLVVVGMTYLRTPSSFFLTHHLIEPSTKPRHGHFWI